ncbi:MAG: family 16 glycoside hydrolase [Gemmataceae bacterium]
MRKISRGLLLAGCLLLIAGLQTSGADKVEPGFTPFFNGKDFTGWKVQKGDNLDGKSDVKNGRIKVVDGMIVIDGKTKGNLVIETQKNFEKDVHIKFDFKAGAGCNNDLYFRGNKFDIKKGGVKNLKEGEFQLVEIVVSGDRVEF